MNDESVELLRWKLILYLYQRMGGNDSGVTGDVDITVASGSFNPHNICKRYFSEIVVLTNEQPVRNGRYFISIFRADKNW